LVTRVGTFSPIPAGLALVTVRAGDGAGLSGGDPLRANSPSGRSAGSGRSSAGFGGGAATGIPIIVGVAERALRMTRPLDHNSNV
jgi:hypothetical protein